MEYLISAIIAHVAVPGFFLISEVLLYKKEFKWKENFIKKTRTILIPWFIDITFWIVLYAVMQMVPFARPFIFSNDSKLISEWGLFQYLDAYLGLTQSPLVYPLWFAQSFFLNLIALPLKWVIDKFPKTTLIILWILLLSGIKSPLFCLEVNALVYFCMGYYLVKYDLHFENIPRTLRDFSVRSWVVNDLPD